MESIECAKTRATPPDRPIGAPAPLRRFAPYRNDRFDVETIVSGCTLVGMLGFVCVLFVQCFELGLVA